MVFMKRVVVAVMILAFSRMVPATQIRIHGLNPQNTNPIIFQMGWSVYYGPCQITNSSICTSKTYTSYNLSVSQFFNQLDVYFNLPYANITLTKSPYGVDSIFSFQLLGSSSVCKAILTNRAYVSISVQSNGTCFVN